MIQINSANAGVFSPFGTHGSDLTGASIASSMPEPSSSVSAKLSSEGMALSSLYEAANAFIQQEHMKPYAGEVRDENGYVLVDPSRYINIEKYNNYLFDKAAGSIVEQAKEQGISLDVNDVLKTLKEENPSVAEIKFNNENRLAHLPALHTARNLTVSDLDDFAELYIAAKENGLNVDDVAVLAFKKRGRNEPNIVWLDEAGIYPVDWDFEKNGSSVPVFTPSASMFRLADEVREKLDKYGGPYLLGEDFLRGYLLHPRRGMVFGNEAWLEIISKALDMKNSG